MWAIAVPFADRHRFLWAEMVINVAVPTARPQRIAPTSPTGIRSATTTRFAFETSKAVAVQVAAAVQAAVEKAAAKVVVKAAVEKSAVKPNLM